MENVIGKRIHYLAMLLCVLVILPVLSACNQEDVPEPDLHALGSTGIFAYTEAVKVDLEYGSDSFGFPLYFVADRLLEEDEISFVRFEGKHVDYLEGITFTRRQIDDVTDVEIEGRYFYPYHFVSQIDRDYFSTMKNVEMPKIWEIQIEAVVVEIDGEEYSIALTYPIRYHYNRRSYNDIEGNHMYGPTMVYTFGLTEQYSVNLYNYTNDILVLDFYFSDFLEATNKQIYYQGVYLGDLNGEDVYAIPQRSQETPGAGGGATIYFNPNHSPAVISTECDNILCTAIVSYQIEGDDTVYTMKFPFNAQGIGNRETAEKYLEWISTQQ